MNIVGLMSWFNEDENLLYHCIEQADFLDSVIALDGRYLDFPDDMYTCSPMNQYNAIREACSDSDKNCQVISGRTWNTEAGKRSHLFELAYLSNADWFYILDPDEIVVEQQGVHEFLQESLVRICNVTFYEFAEPTGVERLHPAIARLKATPTLMPRFFKRDEITVEGSHSRYLSSEGELLWTANPDSDNGYTRLATDLSPVSVHHRRDLRNPYRLQQQQAYYNIRNEKGIEC